MKLGLLKYLTGLLFTGTVSGINSVETAQETIIRDIRRAKKSIKVLSCTADMSYWSPEILKSLEEKKRYNPSLSIEFLVGPELSNDDLVKLQERNVLSLYRLPERPRCDCRIVDDLGTYTSNHGDSRKPRKYLWTFRNVRAARDRLFHYEELKKKAA